MLKLILTSFTALLVSLPTLADQFAVNSYMIRNTASNDILSTLKIHGDNNALVLYYFLADDATLPANYSQDGNLGKVYSVFEHLSRFESYKDIVRNHTSITFQFQDGTGRADLVTRDGIPVGQ